MTKLSEQIQKDGVAMRWIRTAATTITSVAAASAILWTAAMWLVSPRMAEWTTDLVNDATADLRQELGRTGEHLDRVDQAILALEDNITALSQVVARDSSPSWRFSLPDTQISDGNIGGIVTITGAGYKLRECGIPRVDIYFISSVGLYHRFEENSILTSTNRGVAFSVDPDRLQSISYTARIPSNENVRPGRARGFISITYPDSCPGVEEVIAGPLQFRIFPTS